jgi:membrane protease YdiL (CAAX protease family)
MRAHFSRVEPYLTPLLGFSGLYLASLIILSLVLRAAGVDRSNLALSHLASLASAIIATAICVAAFERGRWSLGVFVPPRRAARGLLRGVLAGVAIVAIADSLIMASTGYRHMIGSGLQWSLVLGLLVPAAVGEELVFRGYVLQRLYRLHRGWAICVTSALFTLAHAGNPAAGPIALTNIFLAGVLLALMWAWDESLWMPTWAHVAWNVMSGPILGHELSGIDVGSTLLQEVDSGPAWVTGGDFGIEASVILTVVEVATIALLAWRIRTRERALRRGAHDGGEASAGMPDALSGLRAKQHEEVGSE